MGKQLGENKMTDWIPGACTANGITYTATSRPVATSLRLFSCKVAQIAGAGHTAPYDQPEHFLAIVQTFLRLYIIQLKKEVSYDNHP